MDEKNQTIVQIGNNLYDSIKNVLAQARQTACRAVNFTMVTAYWEIGRLITEDELHNQRADYGKFVLKNIAERLSKEFGKGFDESNLRYMRLFYKAFPICDTLRHELSWSHYRRLLSVENIAARTWYMNEAADAVWSTRQLDRQISTLYYERLLSSRVKEPVIEEAEQKLSEISPLEFIKDPYVLEFLNLDDYSSLHETDIEKAMIGNLQSFLMELGRGFCFVARQKRMRYDDEDFYIDLVFYNSIIKCYILIDLKLGKLSHADVGQMDSYIRMFDDLMKQPDDNPTIGLILCSEKNVAIAKYSVLNDAKQMFASKYTLTLPTVEELQAELERQRKLLEI
ncbi:MAG: PDDEXK nuclease domain-containing protein [Bacteroidales bacterium]|nr:PDDEXK nuclease domain-containing protein [Bacteroidales bacterium]